MRLNCLSVFLFLAVLGLLRGNANAQIPSFFKNGNGTGGNTIPLNTAGQHTQLLYAPGDFNIKPNSGKIVGIYFRNSVGGTSATFTNFRVSFDQTSDVSFLSTTYHTVLTTALPDTNITIMGNANAADWLYIPLTIPYTYDSLRSLIVDIRYTAKTGGMSTTTSASVGDKRRSGTSLTSLTGTTNTTQNDFGMDVVPLNPCIDPPTPGITTFNPGTTVCPGTTVELNLSGNSTGFGQSYKWQESNSASGPFTDISGNLPISRFYISAPLTSKYYRAALSCGATTSYSTSLAMSVNPPLPGGNYTINPVGSGPNNFVSFTSAASSLNCGISGAITIDVAAGIYNERITIGSIAGSSSTNTITFKGAGISQTKITSASTSSADMATIILDGSDHIVFRDMTVEATSASNSVGILLTNAADSNKFVNLKVQLNNTASSTSIAGIVGTGSLTSVTSAGNTANYTLVDSVEVDGGYYGVRFNGASSTAPVFGNTITNSVLTNQYYYGMYIQNNSHVTIDHDSISQLRNSTSYGINMVASGNYTITNNRIYASSYALSCAANQNFYDAGYRTLVANNMISSLSTSHYALQIATADHMHVLHNSIYGKGTGQYAPVYFSDCKFINFRNNAIINDASTNGYAINLASTALFDSLDYNNYFSTSGNLVYLSTTSSYSDLNAWKAAMPQFNQNAYSQDPKFISPTNLYLQPSAPTMYGTYVGIDTDIDGLPRSLTQPTAGARERIAPAINAAVAALSSPTGLFCSGNYDVKVVVRNKGTSQISYITLQWQLNGVLQTPITINAVIDTAGSIAGNDTTITLGNFSFSPGVAINIKAWTENPGGFPDPITEDDTLFVQPTASLSNTLTIGGASPTFTNFTAALDALKNFGVCGPVVFEVRPGTYNARMVIPSIVGSSSINTITFKGSGKQNTTLTAAGTGTTDYGTIVLNGADFITFRDITIANTGATNAVAVLVTNAADSNRFINSKIEVSTTTTASAVSCIVFSNSLTALTTAGNTGNYNLFDSLEIVGGYYGTYIRGTSSSNFIKGNSIRNSTFNFQYYYSIYNYYHGNFNLTNNEISNLRNTTNYGINSNYSSNIIIEKNTINARVGIDVSYNNKIDYNGTRSKIVNNMINAGPTYGLYLSNVDTTDIYHNTIASSGTGTAATLYMATSVNNNLRNNILVNRSTASNANVVNIPTTATFISLNNNNYYSYGGGLAYVSASATYSDLATWKTAQTGYNQASFSEEPVFVSATDLHLQPIGSILKGANVGVSTDIDGNARTVTPTIGAHERVAYTNSAAISEILPYGFCAGNQTIQTRITNIGTNKINSLNINWEIDGIPQAPISLIVPIDTFGSVNGAEQLINLGNWNFQQGIVTNVKVWITLPNGVTDPYRKDDTLSAGLKTGLAGNYFISATGGNYLTIADAVKDLNRSGICGNVVFDIQSGNYEEQLKFTAFYTSSPTNTVTFQSQFLDSTTVNIIWPALTVATNNYVVLMNGTRNVIFNRLTFERSGTGSFSTIFNLNNTNNIHFLHNRLMAPLQTTAESDGSRTSIYSNDAEREDSTLIDNNYFYQNANGVALFGNINNPNAGTDVRNNVFYIGYVGAWFKHNNSAKINRNIISRTGSLAVDFFPISLENCDSLVDVSFNKILHQRGNGIRLLGCAGYVNNPIKVYNNIISGIQTSTTEANGISIESSTAYNSAYIDVYHNTVLMNSQSATTGRAINMAGVATSQSHHINVLNNILVNKGPGYVYYIGANAFSSNLNINYNNIYTAGANIGTYNNTIALPNDGMRSWISATHQDSSSSNVNVNFNNDTALLLTGSSIGDFNLATPITGLTSTDIQGNTRFGTYFYKGAYEANIQLFPSGNTDASLWTIVNPTSPLSTSGIQNLTFTVRNSGLSPLYNFAYNYDLNGTPSFANNWSGVLDSGETTTISIPNVTIPAGANTLKVWVSFANSFSPDLNNFNDTLAIQFNATLPLTGTFNVGVGETYLNLTAIADSLKTIALGGDVVFELTSNYISNETFPVVFSSPANNIYTVTIRPATGVTARVTQGDPGTSNPLIDLDGVSNIVFDGRPGGNGTVSEWILRSTRTATTYGAVVRFINGASNNQLRNLTLEMQSTTSTTGMVHFSTTNTLRSNSNNIVRNNMFRDRTDITSPPAYYQGIYASGTAANPNTNNSIVGNHINNFNNNGIYLTTATGDNWKIDSNHFYYNRSAASTAVQNVIYLVPVGGSTGIRVHGNYIGGSAANVGGASWKHNGTVFTAINSTAYNNFSVTNNVISNIEQTTSATTTALRGIDHDRLGSKVLIEGNTISNLSTKTQNTDFSNNGEFAFNGIRLGNADSAWIKNNNINTVSVADVTTTTAITAAGITITNPIYAAVNNNRITDIINYTQNSSRTTGIMIMNVPQGGVHDVFNNSITLKSNTVVGLSGIMHNTNSFQLGVINVFNNSIYIGGTPSSGSATSYAIYRQFATSFNLYNNLVYCERNGNQRAFYDNGVQNGLKSDYNFYVQSSNPFNSGGTNMNFASWKNLGNDSFGYYATPAQLTSPSLFTATATGNLLPLTVNSASWALNGKAMAMNATDIDGNARSITAGIPADIGAYEFAPAALVEPVTVSATPTAAPSITTLSVYNRPIATINWTSGTVPTDISLKYYSGVAPIGATVGNNINSYYSIDATGGSGFTYDIDLAYTPAEIGTVNESNLTIAKKDGTAAWQHRSNSFVNMVNNSVRDTALTSFSLFTLTDQTNPLPVKLLNFTAIKANTNVVVNWSTASEINVSRFVVEASVDGKTFERVGELKAKGNSSSFLNYTFTHANAQLALNATKAYYRLVTIDNDGTSSLSEVATVQFDESQKTPDATIAYPNPFSENITIAIPSLENTTAEVMIIDLQGRVVASSKHKLAEGTNQLSIENLSALNKGIYFVKIIVSGESKVIKVIKN